MTEDCSEKQPMTHRAYRFKSRRAGRDALDEVVAQNGGRWLQCLPQTAPASSQMEMRPPGTLHQAGPHDNAREHRAQEWKCRDRNRQGGTLRRPGGEMTRARGREPGTWTDDTMDNHEILESETRRAPLQARRIGLASIIGEHMGNGVG
jgi:hypothetical protein